MGGMGLPVVPAPGTAQRDDCAHPGERIFKDHVSS
jgi:hypothetical protein